MQAELGWSTRESAKRAYAGLGFGDDELGAWFWSVGVTATFVLVRRFPGLEVGSRVGKVRLLPLLSNNTRGKWAVDSARCFAWS